MQLIGMLDSPYVRRVAIALNLLAIRFSHRPLSVFRDFDAFATVNPVVKAPTFVTDGGLVLMDSTLILDHLDRLAAPERRLVPDAVEQHAAAQRVTGLALAACEKSVQLVYEFDLRPVEKRHQPWVERVQGQLLAAYGLLEAEIQSESCWIAGSRPMQPDVDVAVAWRFTQDMLPDVLEARLYPKLAAFSARAEDVPAFRAAPPA